MSALRRIGIGLTLVGLALGAGGFQSCLVRLATMGPPSPTLSRSIGAEQEETFHQFESFVQGPHDYVMEVEGRFPHCHIAIYRIDSGPFAADESWGVSRARCQFSANLDGQRDLTLVFSTRGGDAGGFFAVYPDEPVPWGRADLVWIGALMVGLGAVLWRRGRVLTPTSPRDPERR